MVGSGTIGASGELELEIPLPDDPRLVGLRVYSQSLIVPLVGSVYSSNPRRPVIGG